VQVRGQYEPRLFARATAPLLHITDSNIGSEKKARPSNQTGKRIFVFTRKRAVDLGLVTTRANRVAKSILGETVGQ